MKRGPPTISSMLTPQSASSPPPPSPIPPSLHSPLPAQFSILDLELLHFWTTKSSSTYVDFSACIELFKVTVVQLALTHQFLMHEILSMSALHLSLLSSIPSEKARYVHSSSSHLATALSLFQPEIANLTTANCHACFAFSTLIFTHSWAAQDKTKPSALFFVPKDPGSVDGENVQWVKLHRGADAIIKGLRLELRAGPMGPVFQPWAGLDPNRPDPLRDIEERELSFLPSAWNSPSCALNIQQKDTLDFTLTKLRRTFSMLDFNPEISKLSVVMAWFSWISEDFVKMLEEKIPEALLLVVFYCVALKRAAYMWWVEGKAENLLRTVAAELGEPPGKMWERWLRWPVEQVLGGGEVMGFNGQRFNVDRLAVSNIMNVD
jgi:hypothetical protein